MPTRDYRVKWTYEKEHKDGGLKMKTRENFQSLLNRFQEKTKIEDYLLAKKIFIRIIEDQVKPFDFIKNHKELNTRILNLINHSIQIEEYKILFRQEQVRDLKYIELREGSDLFYKITSIERILRFYDTRD
jgi:hypothetical protein